MTERALYCLKHDICEVSYAHYQQLAHLCPYLAYEFQAEVLGGDILLRRSAMSDTAVPQWISVQVDADLVTVTADSEPALVTSSPYKASLCIRQHLANMAAV
jgi:hypothetical protein